MANEIAQDLLAQLTFHYDQKSDVLYCSVGEPREAVSVEPENDDGVVIRLDPVTEKIVGFTVMNFLKRFTEHPAETFSLASAASGLRQ